jgi:hypothetical protein
MSGLRVTLAPRDVSAGLRATCSDVSLDAVIDYASPGPMPGSDVQRRIEALVSIPRPAWVVRIGGLELGFGDGARLSSLGLYADMASAVAEDLPQAPDAPAAWLALPQFDPCDDDVFSVDASPLVLVDRQRRAARVRVADAGGDLRSFSLADGLLVRVDATGCLIDLTVRGIEWIGSAPVPRLA